MLRAGFARVDITPPLGITLDGYFHVRYADGVLDPLLATAVAFDDGEKKAVLMSLDLIGINQKLMAMIRPAIAQRIGTDPEGVFIACTHTHLGPCTGDSEGKLHNPDYVEWLTVKLGDAAVMAMADLAPAQMRYTRGQVPDVAFVRRFRMKDGSIRTNPGRLNPDILEPMSLPDENSSLLILKREGKPEIGIVNFQVHPDVIGGCSISADYPKFVRDTYEALIENSRCMYINGTQGDTNHIDVKLPEEKCYGGYERARYMGRKIAMSVVANYELADPLPAGTIAYAQTTLTVLHQKGRPDQLEEAQRVYQIYQERGEKAAAPHARGMERVTIVAEACRIVGLMDQPDEKELNLTALAVGEVVFAGIPGEPFTDIGRGIKKQSAFTLTIPACCANGYEGYYPMKNCYEEGGYEARSARYQAGTAEKIIEASSKLINELKKQ